MARAAAASEPLPPLVCQLLHARRLRHYGRADQCMDRHSLLCLAKGEGRQCPALRRPHLAAGEWLAGGAAVPAHRRQAKTQRPRHPHRSVSGRNRGDASSRSGTFPRRGPLLRHGRTPGKGPPREARHRRRSAIRRQPPPARRGGTRPHCEGGDALYTLDGGQPDGGQSRRADGCSAELGQRVVWRRVAGLCRGDAPADPAAKGKEGVDILLAADPYRPGGRAAMGLPAEACRLGGGHRWRTAEGAPRHRGADREHRHHALGACHDPAPAGLDPRWSPPTAARIVQPEYPFCAHRPGGDQHLRRGLLSGHQGRQQNFGRARRMITTPPTPGPSGAPTPPADTAPTTAPTSTSGAPPIPPIGPLPADTHRQPWLGRPAIETIFILLPPFLSLAFIAAFPALFHDNGNIPDAWWVILILLIDVAHVYSTLYRTYLDPVSFRRYRVPLLLIPLLGFIGGTLLYWWDGLLFWRVLAYLAVFHFIRQQYGFMRIYSRQELAPSTAPSAAAAHPSPVPRPSPSANRTPPRPSPSWARRIDTLTIYYATLYPLLYWHLGEPRHFNWFVDDDFLLFRSTAIL